MRTCVEQIIKRLQPALAEHGGDVKLIDVDIRKKIVYVRFFGACDGCPLSHATLSQFVEKTIIESCPGIKQVIAVPA